jgi:glycosyltransferase involved in cell wall biosynthesis
MPNSRLYYHLKPYLPWRLRMGARRILARRKLERCQDVWPINEAAGQPPDGWPGWPDGKKFAFVITHDVEGPRGLAKCRQLMQMEKELGFRSSFNFIPEGDYAVSSELRDELTQNGFEVGVHDLHHDGKLYQSRANFSENAKWINHYLKEWRATGFRAGFMLRQMDWLHDLNIRYDASTFDTDPFEPQPGGVNTIFPFWVPKPDTKDRKQKSEIRNGKPVSHSSPVDGYVELPYTLPQDSTLFLVLRECSPEIWFRKLDWIVRRGGMGLVNVHPDYLRFPGEPASSRTYPVEFYEKFLQYAREKYSQFVWHDLPGQIAAHISHNRTCGDWKSGMPAEVFSLASSIEAGSNASKATATITEARLQDTKPRSVLVAEQPDKLSGRLNICPVSSATPREPQLRGKRAAVVLFSYYPADPRPRRAAEALAMEGMDVDLICLHANKEKPRRETVNGVNVFRIPLKRRRGGKISYLFQYAVFIAASFVFLSRRSFSRRYDLVHVHNMPDVLVFSALVPKLLGAKIMLDLHDPMPELMMAIFNLRSESFSVRALKQGEKWSIRFADLILTPNVAFKKLFVSRSCSAEKIHIVMNSPDERIFKFKPVSKVALPRDPSRPFVILYHGSLVARYGLDLAVDALEVVRKSIPTATLLICGESTPYFERVMQSVGQRGLQPAVRYLGMQNPQEIVASIEQCDLGIIPNRQSNFTEINMPTRIFEFLAIGKPVIAPSTQGIRDYFSGENLIFFEQGNVADLARKIEYVASHPQEVQDITGRGQAIYEKHLWQQERSAFLGLARGQLGLENA